jgi:hypothetical protein
MQICGDADLSVSVSVDVENEHETSAALLFDVVGPVVWDIQCRCCDGTAYAVAVVARAR